MLGEQPLRALFLTVDEIEPGRFLWLIVESGNKRTPEGSVASSNKTYGTYGDALDAGVAELKRYSDGNLLIGPRQGEEEDGYPPKRTISGFHLFPV